MKTTLTLTLHEAERIARGAEKKAKELGVHITVAIMDQHGNLKLYRRMDESHFICVRMAQLKASTSSSLPLSTKALGEKNQTLANKPYLAVPGIVLLEGGVPIVTKKGVLIGSIGVSGATPEMDGACAQAGLDTIKEELEAY